MAWDFTPGATKKDIVTRLTKGWKRQQHKPWSASPDFVPHDWQCVTLKHKVIGGVLWTVDEVTRFKPEGKQRERTIGCHLLERGYGGWGFKVMCEAMHPYYYTCPLEYLDLVPVACPEWREKVRLYHDAAL
jgi:hypothetical protein